MLCEHGGVMVRSSRSGQAIESTDSDLASQRRFNMQASQRALEMQRHSNQGTIELSQPITSEPLSSRGTEHCTLSSQPANGTPGARFGIEEVSCQ